MSLFSNPILGAAFGSQATSLEAMGRFLRALVDDRIDSTDLVAWAALLLGVTCGVLGAFIVLRRQSLLGDAIGHAVLPGVCIGFLLAGSRSLGALMAGALVAGLLAAMLISLLQRTTVLKAGECMGVVFTGFYGLGIVLLKAIQNRGLSGQSGLDKFLFGQIVGVTGTDVMLMGAIAGLALACVVVFWRKLAISSFDEQFAMSIGLPVRAVHYLLTALLTVSIVISIQAVGVVLVAAMLVTPAATAYLLTDRLHRMVMLSGLFGAVSGLLGAFLSLLGQSLPTGAFMVLGASTLFGLAFFFAPTHGYLPRLGRLWARRKRTDIENLLKSLYVMSEARAGSSGFPVDAVDRRFGIDDVAAIRHEPVALVRKVSRVAGKAGFVDPSSTDPLILTDEGFEEARRVVRNHRLWELFLTQEAHLAADHVHADAEYIEHVLPKEVIERLERMLENPIADPHGRPIPSLAGTMRAGVNA